MRPTRQLSAPTRAIEDSVSLRDMPKRPAAPHSSGGAAQKSLQNASRTNAGHHVEFWYSRRQAILLLIGMFLLARSFGELTPPFQSPDEFNHLKRAYLLSRGVVVPRSRGTHTGGEIDQGLLAYMDCFQQFPLNYGAKVDQSNVFSCEKIRYTETQRFSDLSNTAMYFPLLYLPQAFALFVGERTSLSVGDSYYLARLFACCATLAILMWALIVDPVPPIALALFMMPMCLFQLCSTSLDAMSFATTVLAASLFRRAHRTPTPFSPRLHAVLAICLLLLAASRIIYVALTPLLIYLYRVRRSPIYVVSFVAVLSLSVLWIVFALTTVHGQGAISQAMSSSDIIKYYLFHPARFLGVTVKTVTDMPTLRGYWQMFVGVLGWLDTPIGSAAYIAFTIEIVAIALVSTPFATLRLLNKGNLALALAGTTAVVLLFLVALSAWTVHPATMITGIQGRYLYPIALLFAFAFWTGRPSRMGATLSFAILILMAATSVEFVFPRLLSRYYVH